MKLFKLIIYLVIVMLASTFKLKGQDSRCRALDAVISNKDFIKKFSDCVKSDTVLIIDTENFFNCSMIDADRRYIITDVVPDSFNINISHGQEYEDMLMISYFLETNNSIKIGFLALATHVQLIFDCSLRCRKVRVKLISEGVF